MAIPEKHKRFCFRNNRSVIYCYFKYQNKTWAFKQVSDSCTLFFFKKENDFASILAKMNSEVVYTLNIEDAILYEFNEKDISKFFI